MKSNTIIKNYDIEAQKVLAIRPDGSTQEMKMKSAVWEAQHKGLDLVQITNDEIPVCKMINADKYLYEKQKKEKEIKKKQRQKAQELKEIHISSGIDTGDMATKAKHIDAFLNENKKVKITMRLKGRESRELAFNAMNTFLEFITTPYDKSVKPILDGRNIVITIASVK